MIQPKSGGNIGAVARAMMNFDFHHLILVDPCELNDECYARAMHAQKILDDAQLFSSFEEMLNHLDYLVATSSIENQGDKKNLRNAMLLDDFTDKIFEVEGRVGLIFGREDYGLYNEEIAKCDTMVRIPTSELYPSLNLSHAVNLLLYELYSKKIYVPKEKRHIGRVEKEKLYKFFSDLLDEINYPEYKKEKTNILFQRVMGRAMPSKWEYHKLMGIFSKTLEKIQEKQKEK